MADSVTNVTLDVSTVNENAANSTVIGTLGATDTNVSATFTYSLTDNAGGRFALQNVSGTWKLIVNNTLLLDYEIQSQYTITVVASDNVGGTSMTKSFGITLNDVSPESVTGSSSADTLTSGNGDDFLNGAGGDDSLSGGSGDDSLNGGSGADTMVGGAGDDTFVVDDVGDKVIGDTFFLGQQDFVQTSVTFSLNTADANTIKNMTLTGSSAIDATGNPLANLLIGNTAANRIDGNSGSDTMRGGGGDDTYYVDNIADVVDEGIIGTAAADTLVGTASAEWIFGGAANDTLTGGGASDGFVFDTAPNASTNTDLITDFISGTDDLILSTTIFTGIAGGVLASTAFLSGAGITAATTAAQRIIYNTTTGDLYYDADGTGATAAVKFATLGSSTHPILVSSDIIALSDIGTGGTELVYSGVDFTLGANVENLILNGPVVSGVMNTAANIDGTGNASANRMIGNDGNNKLDGGAGADTMSGGAGNDTYVVENASDVVDEGIAGTSAGEAITGTSAGERIYGGLGNDTMTGGSGADGFVFDSTLNATTNVDRITDFTAGTDQIVLRTSIFGGLSEGPLTAAQFGSGAGMTTAATTAQRIIYNTTTGDLYYDADGTGATAAIKFATLATIPALTATDFVAASAAGIGGNDEVQAAVSWTLGANIENLVLTGTSSINGAGNAQANKITGNTAANMLDGGAGSDTLLGGTGNDTYVVDSTSDVVTEGLGAGVDAVWSSASWTLGLNIEDLILTGTAVSGKGNGLGNVMRGNASANTLDGGGGGEADTMIGGGGNDTYTVDNVNDIVDEGYIGTTAADVMTGSSKPELIFAGLGNDTMTGNSGADGFVFDTALNAATNVDQITDFVAGTDKIMLNTSIFSAIAPGAVSAVMLNSGAGFVTASISANRIIYNTTTGDLYYDADGTGASAPVKFATLTTRPTLTAADFVAFADFGTGGTDTVVSTVSYTIGGNVENLTLGGTLAINATGNSLSNYLTGNGSANKFNYLAGATAADTMDGGAGDDTYYVFSSADVVKEGTGGGKDTIVASFAYTLSANVENLTYTGGANLDMVGSGLNNYLTGNDGKNLINGMSGIDTMAGGAGDDSYVVDNTGDRVIELVGGGVDLVTSSVSFSLQPDATTTDDQVDNLTLSGTANINATGNGLANTLTGNGGNNRLDGLLGADVMIGLGGNDTYYVDNGGDTVTDTTGIDTVVSTITYTLGATIENLTLSGGLAINGTGNTLANIITGNAAANLIDGLGGNDDMRGGLGDDTYVVDSMLDKVLESTGSTSGNDLVKASVSFTLSSNVEKLLLTGAGNTTGTGNITANDLTGNTAANTLSGLAGNDTLNGGAGNDTLVGGDGQDYFVFATTLNATTNVDQISDFNIVDDFVKLDDAIFTALTAGALAGTAFISGANLTTASTAAQRIIYNTTTGDLYYDANGSAVGAAIKFAHVNTTLGTHPVLTAADFIVF